MNFSESKNYIFILISLLLFVISTAYAAFIYLKWDEEVDEKKYAVEVNLPVVNWDQYLKLSKQR